jgi:hypothetical protein
MTKNLVLAEREFDDFKRLCRKKGFDLSYYGPQISGSIKEMKNTNLDGSRVILLSKHWFINHGVPYSVAEWQQEKWCNNRPDLEDKFFREKD